MNYRHYQMILRMKRFFTNQERCDVLTGYVSLGCRPGGDWANTWHWTKHFTIFYSNVVAAPVTPTCSFLPWYYSRTWVLLSYLVIVYLLYILYFKLSCVYCWHLMCCTMRVLLFLLYMPDCWLEVTIRKVLGPATSTQVFLGCPMSVSKYWDGSQDSK